MTEPRHDEHDHLLDHSYDGIQEYDNPLPGWWTLLFWATIVFSVLYSLNLPGIGVGKGRIANYEAEMAKWREQTAAARPPGPAFDDAQLVAMAHDPARVAAGRRCYETNCVACHRADGGGSIGPNLTDEFWIHGGRPTEILATVSRGVPDKGMPTWSQVLKPEELPAVTAYVLTLRGTNPPAPKEPQGARHPPGAAPPP